MTDPNFHQHECPSMGTEAWFKDFFDHACDLIQCVDSKGNIGVKLDESGRFLGLEFGRKHRILNHKF